MKKGRFITLKLKQETAQDFRRFSKELNQQQTETLQLMLDFFKNHRLHPSEDLGPNMKTLESNINRRINATIAIIRDIEKTQTKPVLAMLQLLFQEDGRQKRELLVERPVDSSTRTTSAKPQTMNGEHYKKWKETISDLKMLLEKVVVVRNNFGSPYLRLKMEKHEFEALQNKYNNTG